MSTSSTAAPPRSRGRLLLWLGLLLAVAGPVAYGVQAGAGTLTTPWYALGLAVLGTVLVLRSLFLRFTVFRILGFLFCAALAAGEGWFLLSETKLPAYTGPLAAGQPFPEFHATRADGTSFTRTSLEGDQNTVLVFFRGHW